MTRRVLRLTTSSMPFAQGARNGGFRFSQRGEKNAHEYAHTAFEDPASPPDAAPRESIGSARYSSDPRRTARRADRRRGRVLAPAPRSDGGEETWKDALLTRAVAWSTY